MGQHDDHGEDAEASVDVTPDRRPSLDRACRPATARIFIISRGLLITVSIPIMKKYYFVQKQVRKA